MQGIELFGTPRHPAWTPGDRERDRSRLLRAMRRWGYDDLATLHRFSVSEPETFWRAAVEDLGIAFEQPFTQVRDESIGKELPRWFTGGRLNVATLCSHRHADGPRRDRLAVVYEGDDGQRRTLTFAQLDVEVRRFAANLTALGVGQGDRVVLFVPVVPEATVAFLACAMIGAITVPAFTGYSPEALATRVRDSGAVALITSDATTRRGRIVPMKATVDEALEALETLGADTALRHVIVVRHLGVGVTMRDGRDLYLDELDQDPAPVGTVALEANTPLCIVYTSGTTGRPKGIVHSHGGFAVKAGVDFGYGFDVQEDDVVSWISDMGWLVGPLLIVGCLQLGATIVLTEGVPDHPTPDRLFEIIERNGVTLQGVAPTAMRAIAATGERPTADLGTLRAFASTGEAWDEKTWWWLFDEIGNRERPIMNYTGGTEIGGGLLTSYPFLPMEPAAFNGPLPGIDVAVLDPDGAPVIGAVGELVALNTWPGMTHGFWHDDERYLDTYWRTWPGVWHHGDVASVDAAGSWRVHGRSDDTIKVSGRRIGPAEIEAGLLKDPRIVEAAAIGVPDERRGQSVVGFVVLRDQALRRTDVDDVVATAEANVGRSFAPRLEFVRTLPRTKNGKVMRRAIRSRYLGESVGDLSSLDPATPLEDIPVHTSTQEAHHV
ncbi:MAG: acsA3 [Marmoricola sp.]|nr:acsA3 [Marmoricola sp.]